MRDIETHVSNVVCDGGIGENEFFDLLLPSYNLREEWESYSRKEVSAAHWDHELARQAELFQSVGSMLSCFVWTVAVSTQNVGNVS